MTSWFKIKEFRYLIPVFLLAGLIYGGSIYESSKACAAFAASSCDPQYYESLEARATLEAQREITQNQNLIVRPDSVLEYTCFDMHLDHLANETLTAPFFSQSGNWGNPAGNINAAMNSITNAADAYDNANFDHDLIGGRGPGDWDINAATYASYDCDVMNRVWLEAKCMDLMDETAHDGFFTFATYEAEEDMRRLPDVCPAAAKFDFQDGIDTSTGTATPWNEEDVDSYFYLFDREGDNYTDPNFCGNDLDPASSKVKTGLTVRRTVAPVVYNEHVCLVPGCYYVPTGLDTGTCELP